MHPQNQLVFVNNLTDEQSLDLMDILTKRATEQEISTHEYVRRWACGDELTAHAANSER
jgi:hypothetical protein